MSARVSVQTEDFNLADEIAELVLWLASPATDYITGQTININGGAYFS